jgi:hypothetical protein
MTEPKRAAQLKAHAEHICETLGAGIIPEQTQALVTYLEMYVIPEATREAVRDCATEICPDCKDQIPIRCDRAYDLETGDQIPNWAWKQENGEWVRQTNKRTP